MTSYENANVLYNNGFKHCYIKLRKNYSESGISRTNYTGTSSQSREENKGWVRTRSAEQCTEQIKTDPVTESHPNEHIFSDKI